jgi:tRNA(adenine34) deaminase
MAESVFRGQRRIVLRKLSYGLVTALGAAASRRAFAQHAADRRFMEQAFAMLRLARTWGDQPYGAVLVMGGLVVGEGPSRVVQRGDPDAHAEREAIRDAQRRLGRDDLSGAVIYSTSRPCSPCEKAAARAKVAQMIYGRDMQSAGAPRA